MHDGTLDSDELRDVGRYMRLLVANVAVARSDLKRSQHQLAHAERLASVGKLAASVAHEIRNPLTAMKMWIFTIRRGSDKSPELEHKFDLVAEEIARLENIIHNFLEFSRPPQLRIQRLSLSELLTKTIELLQHRLDESGCQVEVREPRSLPDVLADQAQLKQVFMNLLTNSMETMPEGGSIRLDCATGELHGQSMVVVRVTDQGAGMTSDVQSRVFEPFFTTKDSGTGLGLCIAASIMARHDGALMLENTTSAGTVFAVWIPTWEDSDRE